MRKHFVLLLVFSVLFNCDEAFVVTRETRAASCGAHRHDAQAKHTSVASIGRRLSPPSHNDVEKLEILHSVIAKAIYRCFLTGFVMATVFLGAPTSISTSSCSLLPHYEMNCFLLHPQEAMAAAAADAPIRKTIATTLDIPRLGRLMDPAQAMDDYSSKLVLQEIQAVEQETGTELQVLVVDNIDSSPKKFATRLFNKWGIGSAEKNNGVLVLVVLDQRRIEVEVGRQLDRYMNQAWTVEMLEQEAIPAFKVQQYGQGVYNTVAAVANRLRQVDSGIVVAKPSVGIQGPSFLENVAIGGFALVGTAVVITEWLYPMGNLVCKECGANKWNVVSDVVQVEATDRRAGRRRRNCVCQNCGYQDGISTIIPKYDRRVVDSNGRTTYYYRDRDGDSNDSGGGGGGSSSDGGGGGASW